MKEITDWRPRLTDTKFCMSEATLKGKSAKKRHRRCAIQAVLKNHWRSTKKKLKDKKSLKRKSFIRTPS